MSKTQYVIVQHSAFGYGGDPTFKHGLEARSIHLKMDRNIVARVGGIMFDTYSAAEVYLDDEQYPSGYTGIIPKAPGKFAKATIDGLRIYVP